jgi:uncharacterized protein YutE (UPF0331/DUF86 family)
MKSAVFSLIDVLVNLHKNEHEKLEKTEKDYAAVDLFYDFLIGAFVYLYSDIEMLVGKFFSSLFTGYENDLQHLVIEKGITKILLKTTKKIFSNRSASYDQNKFSRLIEDFNKLNKERNRVVHGCWGINPKGGYILSKTPIKSKNRQNCDYFYSIDELIDLKEQCKKWIGSFLEITKLCDIMKLEDRNDFYEYLVAVGKFVFRFSQLEFSLRACVSDTYSIESDAFVFCEESYGLDLLEHLYFKFKNASGLIEMNKDFKKLNDIRNSIVHDCCNFVLTLKEINKVTSQVGDLNNQYSRFLVSIRGSKCKPPKIPCAADLRQRGKRNDIMF